jgi:DNA-binding transcriptional ArsR family regulator
MPKALPADVLEKCAESLRVLAHPTRLRIVELLAARRLTVGELAEELDAPQAVVSQHLVRMRHVGLLTVEREGSTACYRVASPACTAVLACIREHFV